MLAWATLPVNTHRNWLAKRLSIVRGFASHLHTIDPATEVPPADLLPWQRCRATPYLYSDDEVAALVTAATSLQTPYRVLTYQTLIGLLAVTGMRVGEAIALDRDDIDMTQRCTDRSADQVRKVARTAGSSEHYRGARSLSLPSRPPTCGRKCPCGVCFEYRNSIVVPQCSMDFPTAPTPCRNHAAIGVMPPQNP